MASRPNMTLKPVDDGDTDGSGLRPSSKRSKENRLKYAQKINAATEEAITGVEGGNSAYDASLQAEVPFVDESEPNLRNDGLIAAGTASADIARADGAGEEATHSRSGELVPISHLPAIGGIDFIDCHQIVGWAWSPSAPSEPINVEVLIDGVLVLEVCADQFRPDLLEANVGNGCHGLLVPNFADYLPPGTHSVSLLRVSDGLELPGSPKWVTQPELGSEEVDIIPENEVIVDLEMRHPDTPDTQPGQTPSIPLSAFEAGEVSDRQLSVGRSGSDAASLVAVPRTPVALRGRNASKPPTTLPVGSIDRLDHDEISGWVWDSARPDESIDIEILDDDVVVLKVCADRFRPDLVEAGAGSGYHGFSIQHLGGVFPFSRHRVRVRRADDGRDLPGSPAWISQAGLDFRAASFMQQAVLSAVRAATKADDLAQPLSHLLHLLNELINAQEDLARAEINQPQLSPLVIAGDLQLTDRTRELVELLQYGHAPLHFPPSDEPEVSVIIPVYNKFSYTYNCLKSIEQALPKRPFEIIIADDCSTDETILSALVFSGAVRIVRNATNSGFVRTCNAGAAAAKGKYLFFLNNDTLVKEGWLDELVETFEQVPNVGIAGSKLLFEDGSLQEAGGIIWRLGDGWNWGRGRDPNEPAFLFLRDADWVSGAALMIEHTMFRDLGGFDELYVPAYYEDTDLAFRVRARGKRVVVQPASQIVHLEGISAGTDTSGPGMKRFQVINHAKFYQRWKDTLITHRFNGQQPELEAERQVRRRAYFIDDTVPTPDQDAGSNAAVAHMRALMELGYKVTFLPADNMAKIDPYTAQLQKLGIECQYYPHYWSVEEVFRKATHKPDLVYLHRYTNASKYATMVRRYFPECRVVYSVADLHFLRMERQAQVDPGSASASQVANQRRAEMAAIQSVDCVIVHSPVEANMLHDVDPALNVKIVPWTVRPRPPERPFAERSGTAFVGGFGHPPNVDAVRYYVAEIAPMLNRQLPDCTTYLVGSKMPDEMTDLQVPGVKALGFVPVLGDILSRLRCTVVPLRYGAGIKGKVLESFAHGLPCIMTEVAAEGLEMPEDLAWLVARSAGEFADKVVRVHEDEELNRRLSDAGLAYIERRHSAGVVKDALQGAVAG